MHIPEIRWAAVVFLSGAAVARGDGAPDASRYAVITERAPFGAAASAPAAAGAPAANPILDALRVSAIAEAAPGAPHVGLVNQKTGRSYYLAVGESEDGIEIVSVAMADQTVTVRAGGATATLRLQGGPAAPPAGPRTAALRSPDPSAPPRWTREQFYQGREQEQFFGRNYASGLTQRPWQLDLSERQARTLAAFEDELGAGARARFQEFAEARAAVMNSIRESQTTGDGSAAGQHWAEMRNLGVEQGKSFQDLNHRYYEGLRGILTPAQLEQVPAPP